MAEQQDMTGFTTDNVCYISRYDKDSIYFGFAVQEWTNEETGEKRWTECNNPTVNGFIGPNGAESPYDIKEDGTVPERPPFPVEAVPEPEPVNNAEVREGYTPKGPCYINRFDKDNIYFGYPIQEYINNETGESEWFPCKEPTTNGIIGPNGGESPYDILPDGTVPERPPLPEPTVPEPEAPVDYGGKVVPGHTAKSYCYINRYDKDSEFFGHAVQEYVNDETGESVWLSCDNPTINGAIGPNGGESPYDIQPDGTVPERPPFPGTGSAPGPPHGPFRVIMYHSNWSIYGRDYHTAQLPKNCHDIMHSFVGLHKDPVTGLYVIGYNSSEEPQPDPRSSDNFADFEKVYDSADPSLTPPDTFSESTSMENPNGMFGQYRKMPSNGYTEAQVKLSVGGWSWSNEFSNAIFDEANRESFANSIIDYFKVNDFYTGISLDWEFVSELGETLGLAHNVAKPGDATRYVTFCKLLRAKFDQEGWNDYTIGIAVSVSKPNVIGHSSEQIKEFAEIDNFRFELMSYDLAGGWSTICSHHTNLYPDPGSSVWSCQEAVEMYLGFGAKHHQLFLGVALYSRNFFNTDGFGTPCNQGDNSNEYYSFARGVSEYKHIVEGGLGIDDKVIEPFPGETMLDPVTKGAYRYDPIKRNMITFDSPESIWHKIQYCKIMNLGGLICWDSGGDSSNNELQEVLYRINEIPVDGEYTIPPLVSSTVQGLGSIGTGVASNNAIGVQDVSIPDGGIVMPQNSKVVNLAINTPPPINANISIPKGYHQIGVFDMLGIFTVGFVSYKFWNKPSKRMIEEEVP